LAPNQAELGFSSNQLLLLLLLLLPAVTLICYRRPFPALR
jgi:hypothetical protein